MNVEVGDWVRFMQNGGLVLAQVHYIQRREPWERCDKVITDRGTVSVAQILEIRKAKQ